MLESVKLLFQSRGSDYSKSLSSCRIIRVMAARGFQWHIMSLIICIHSKRPIILVSTGHEILMHYRESSSFETLRGS